ncbi:acetyl-CoA synthetase-like protein [Saccharata proteae CBS 121410]|uniref:Acetyl-CoA synthetase-like protein n=1 Tax=Saccharata proteae CBS 121410 TaxID=1314787 RepID=A0A9P4HNT2_9PEZI|nr:acetyl-CoA synthetase-like protein [Saccharata proteae CBS 121410]
MAETNSAELQSKLQELDRELEEGDITQKGYEKRRTVLLSQYMNPAQLDELQGNLRALSMTESVASPVENHRSSSFAAYNLGTPSINYPSGDVPRVQSPSAYGGPNNGEYFPSPRGSVSGPSMLPPSQVGRFQERQLGVRNSIQRQSSYGHESFVPRPQTPETYGPSREGTMIGSDYAFNPATQPTYQDLSPGGTSRLSTMLDAGQGYFSDFAGQQMPEAQRDSYGGPNRYSSGDAFSPTAAIPPPMLSQNELPTGSFIECQLPLEPREVPFAVYDPHNGNVPMSKFDNLGAVLRHRGRTNARQPAYWVLDPKGKETASITWEKLASKAEKVAQVIRDKSNLYRGDRVALVYRDTEIIDFAIALLGCFIAGVVAVPMNAVDDYARLSLLLTTTQAHLALTTDNNLKAFQRDISNSRQKWPTGVEWWKTNEFGSYHPKKKDEIPALQVPDLAYIEFSRAPTGDLRGVVLSHRTIMHQMACLSAIISSINTSENKDTFNPGLRDKNGAFISPAARGASGEVILSYLDPRSGPGMILGVLYGVYGGHTTVWLEPKTVETPGLYAHLISKYRTTIMVADYPGLKRAAYNYQQDPMATRNFKKNTEPNFASVKICLIDTLTVDCEFHEVLADRWLRPMRNPRARELVAPMLCLPEHGGMIISVRDWLGGEERMGCPLSMDESDTPPEEKPNEPENTPSNGYSSLIGGGGTTKKTNQRKSRTELSEALLDKEALKTNEIVVLAMGDEAKRRSNEPGTVRVGAFGYPIPDATLALVDPETNLLCSPYAVGEIWVDSPSLSGGFWALPKHTESIFHARPYRFMEGNPTPVLVEPEFLRTGLLGCIIEGKIFVLGLYEDRIRQRVEWVEHGVQEAEHRYFFVQHLVVSIMKTVPKIYDCSAFDSHVNAEYLPIILIETQAASTAPTTTGGPPRQLDIAFLDSLSERVMELLYQEHHLRVYCVMITAPNTLPRVVKNGRREIGNMLCRKGFDNGELPCVHVKFGVERAVQNLPVGDDPAGGIWSPLSTAARQDLLMMQDKQYSGVDYREVVIDDKTSTPLNQFTNIHDLLQWRVSRQAEELSYCTIDGRGKEGKGVNWRKLDLKIAGVAMYLRNKVKIQAGDHLVLMYTHSEDFVYAIHACFCLGVIAIPMPIIDQNRLGEDAPALLHMVADFRIKAILVNNEVDHALKQKVVSQHLKQTATALKVNMPSVYNTAKPPKQSSGCREQGLTMRPAWVQPGYPVLIWTYWTPDQRRVAVQLGHDTLMALCKVQKETCQMTSTRPVLGCVRSTIGLGFIHTCLMGTFLATPTYLVSPVDFAQNPNILFQTLSRYKIKDTYATSQMLDFAMNSNAGKSTATALHELKNLMISTDGRPRVDVYQKVRLHFAAVGLERTSINTIYSHVLNPMVASRSYMCIEPIELWLEMNALRRGLVCPVDPDTDPTALLVQDSGMVPVSTQISIVNPETNRLCLNGEFGEIWVQSEANAHCFYGSKDQFDFERFNGRTEDGDPNVRYMRTGDLGFLYNVSRPIGPGGTHVEMQCLFVLGSIGETFEVNGLSHFPMDIENSVERCHRNIVPGGCAVFQAGGLVVILVEIFRKNFLASIVPVIVNAVLNEHHLVTDIVAFVSKGDFPRSRLGEKQRGKILATWVTRKMRTIAQFGIRDPDGADSQITEVAEEPGGGHGGASRGMSMVSGMGALQHGGGGGGNGSVKGPSSLRKVTSASALPDPLMPGRLASMSHLEPPPGIVEMPAGDYDDDHTHLHHHDSIAELPDPSMMAAHHEDNNRTPTEQRKDLPPAIQVEQHAPRPLDYSPVDMSAAFDDGAIQPNSIQPSRQASLDGSATMSSQTTHRAAPHHHQQHYTHPPQPSYAQKPYLDDDDDDDAYVRGLGSLGGGGGLRVANRASADSELSQDWLRDAAQHINFGSPER